MNFNYDKMNMPELVLSYKSSSKSGTRLIPNEDAFTALSVNSIGRYYATDEYHRIITESIDLFQSITVKNKEKNVNKIVKPQIESFESPPQSPQQQREILRKNQLSRKLFTHEEYQLFNSLTETIDESLLPKYQTKLSDETNVQKYIRRKYLQNNQWKQIADDILAEAECDYKRALKESIIQYVLMNKKVAKKIGIDTKVKYRANKIHVIRAPVPWHQQFLEAKDFNQKFNYICDPIVIEIMQIWDKRFREINIFQFNLENGIDIDTFKSVISINCHKMRSILTYDWISACSQVILQRRSKLINLNSVKEPHLFETIATLNERLMRQLILNNIRKWYKIVNEFSSKSQTLFNISIEYTSLSNMPQFVPPLDSWDEMILFPIKELIKANEEIPRMEQQLILMKPKDYEIKYIRSVKITDIVVVKVINKILRVLHHEINCNSILSHYYREFLSSLLPLDNKKNNKHYDVNEIRNILSKSEEIQNKLIYQSNYYFSGIFRIHCLNYNSFINNAIKRKCNQLIERKVKEIMELSQYICDLFVTMERDIEKENVSTTELINQMQQLKDYKLKVNLIFHDIEYVEDHWSFLVEEGAFFINDADFDLLHQLHNWPLRIKSVCEQNEQRFIISKTRAECTLKEMITAFENKLHDLERVLNDIKKKRLSSPLESIPNNVKLLDDIEIQLNCALQELVTINSEEKLLGLPLLSKFPLIHELIKSKVPLDNIWRTANTFHIKESEWMSKSLKLLNVMEVRNTVDALLSTTIQMTESFHNHTDLLQNAHTLHFKIDSFNRKFVPLLQVLCNPVLRERHWHQISEIIGQEVTPESCRTLNDVIKLSNVSKYINEIENLGSIAMKEHALEVFLEKMKNDWLEDWPTDALEIAANKFLEGEHLEIQLKEKCANAFNYIHEDARQFIALLRVVKTKKKQLPVYVTPPLFIELILTFKDLLKKKQREILAQQTRYMGGVEKLDLASYHVDLMRNKLINEYHPQLITASNQTECLMIHIEKETLQIENKKEVIAADESIANRSAASAQQIKDECTKDLAEAIPAIQCAIAALDTLKAEDITFLRTMKNPPSGVKMVLEAVCIIKGLPPDRKLDPNGSGSLIDDYWSAALKMISDIKFLESLKNFDRDNVPREGIELVRDRYLHSPEFDPTVLCKVSIACEGLAKWVKAIDIYDRVINVVKPKKGKLESAEQELYGVMDQLHMKKKQLQETSDKLQQLNDQFAAMSKKKKDLEENIDFCSLKLERAEQLIQGLDGEKRRWKKAADALSTQHENIVGDILLSAATIVYTSALNPTNRRLCIDKWQNYLKIQCKLSFTEPFSIINALGIPIQMQTWTLAGLSTDQFQSENGIIVQNAKRFPFIIDPCQIASKWIKRLHTNITVIDYHHMNDENGLIKETLFNSISKGNAVLIDNVDHHELNPILTQMLKKELVLKNGIQHLKFHHHNLIQYSPEFKLYICTEKLLHLPPITTSRVTLVNWCLDEDSAQICVDSEKSLLLQMRAKNEKQLIELEDQILQLLSTAETNVLEDESAIHLLVTYKELAQHVANAII